MPSGGQRRTGRAAQFVRERGGGQIGLFIASLAVLVSAPFGGLQEVETPGASQVAVGEVIGMGPLDLTVRGAASVPKIGTGYTKIRPSVKGNRILAVVVDVRNPTNVPIYATALEDAVRVVGGGVLPGGPDGKVSAVPVMSYLADHSQPGIFNPGLTATVVLAFEHTPGSAEELTMLVCGYDFIEEGSLRIQTNFWVVHDRVDHRVTLAVETLPRLPEQWGGPS